MESLNEYFSRRLATKSELTPEDIQLLSMLAGPMDGHTASDEEEWDDDITEKYKRHLVNYLYKYKPEAKQVDPSIDPNENQIGIMAQDLEQVNPSCVRETENGTKVVDTGKLALMNAGAIADVARQCEELKARLDKLEAAIGL